MIRKTILLAVSTLCLSTASLLPAYGAEQEISSINLSFSWDKDPKGGDIVGHVYASTDSKQFIVEGAEYTEKDDTWIFGTKPQAEVELSARQDCYFRSSSKSIFTLSGCQVQFKEASIDDDGSTLVLLVSFPVIDDILPGTTATSWDGDTAVWDEVGGASRYEIKLYKDSKSSASVTTASPAYNFSSYMNTDGDYTFAVRALGRYSTQAGPWSKPSDSRTISREDAWYNSNGRWKRVPGSWSYVYKNGDYPVNTWRLIEDKWYYFDQKGHMAAECYVKADEEDFYYWLGKDGSRDETKSTSRPDTKLYEILE